MAREDQDLTEIDQCVRTAREDQDRTARDVQCVRTVREDQDRIATDQCVLTEIEDQDLTETDVLSSITELWPEWTRMMITISR